MIDFTMKKKKKKVISPVTEAVEAVGPSEQVVTTSSGTQESGTNNTVNNN